MDSRKTVIHEFCISMNPHIKTVDRKTKNAWNNIYNKTR